MEHELTSSTIHLQQHKRKKTADVQPSSTIDLTGKAPATTRPQTDIATTAVSFYLDELEHKTRVKKQVIQDLASWLDTFVDNYAGEHQADHRSEARTYIGKLANYLNSVAFSATTTTSRMPNDQQGAHAPRSNGLGEPADKPVSWAGLARSAHASNPTENIRVTDKREGNPKAVPARRNGKEDNRILIRLSTEHRAHREQPFALRAALRREFGDLNLQLTDIPSITPTNTGWALHVTTRELRDKLLEPAAKNRLGKVFQAEAVELPETWYTYAVPDVPYSFPDYTEPGSYVDTADVIADEVFIKAKSRPIRCKPSRHGPNPTTGRGTWLVSFLSPVNAFRLFDCSGLSKLVEKKPVIELHNPGCQGYCDRKRCNREPRCNNCGQELRLHPGEPCAKAPMCANCKGPFQAGHDGCAAVPKRVDGRLIKPSGKELRKIRKAGARRYRAATTRQEAAVQEEATQEAAAQEGAIQEATPRETDAAEEEMPALAAPPENLVGQEAAEDVIVVQDDPDESGPKGPGGKKRNGRKRARSGSMSGTRPTHVPSPSQSALAPTPNLPARGDTTMQRRARPTAIAARENWKNSLDDLI